MVRASKAPGEKTKLHNKAIRIGFYYFYLCLCLVSECHVCESAVGVTKGVRSLGAGVTDSCELLEAGTGKRTWILCTIRTHFV